MKTLKSLDIVFENCDYIVVNREDVLFLEMKNIDKSVLMAGSGNIVEISVANSIKFGLRETILTRYTRLGETVSDKLHYLDISQITLNFENGESDTYFTAWTPKDDKDYRNGYQVNDYSENGAIVIIIDKEIPVIK